jgi:putative YphP/YqiW family bacilliredoxin
MPYPEMLVTPMRAELTNNGFEELKSSEAVNEAFEATEGTMLLVVNSVCGCAAGSCRPGVVHSLKGDKKPAKLYTVFAGQDLDAVSTARENMLPYPPSSPAIALFKDGKLVHMIERHNIEGRTAQMIADNLSGAYEQYC